MVLSFTDQSAKFCSYALRFHPKAGYVPGGEIYFPVQPTERIGSLVDPMGLPTMSNNLESRLDLGFRDVSKPAPNICRMSLAIGLLAAPLAKVEPDEDGVWHARGSAVDGEPPSHTRIHKDTHFQRRCWWPQARLSCLVWTGGGKMYLMTLFMMNIEVYHSGRVERSKLVSIL